MKVTKHQTIYGLCNKTHKISHFLNNCVKKNNLNDRVKKVNDRIQQKILKNRLAKSKRSCTKRKTICLPKPKRSNLNDRVTNFKRNQIKRL